jgi:hypothetical protein
LRILFAPSNIASFASITTEALNKIPGIQAKGFSTSTHKYWEFGKEWTVIQLVSWKKNPLRRLYQILSRDFKLIRLIFWADIIHWQWDIGGETTFDLHYIILKYFRKRVVIEWLGSDIRIPEVVSNLNPYYKMIWENGKYNYGFESFDRSSKIQHKFWKLKATPAVSPEMSLFVNRELFHRIIILYPRVMTRSITPFFPSNENKVPKIVHAPSAMEGKGTPYVRKAVEALKRKNYLFEYIEVHDQSKQKSIEAIKGADVFLDQFICGSYGMAACEAMAFGKPVFCYLMPSVAKLLPEGCPIINSTVDQLEFLLEKFINDSSLRNLTGKKSREYVEKYHDGDKIALSLVGTYKSLLVD